MSIIPREGYFVVARKKEGTGNYQFVSYNIQNRGSKESPFFSGSKYILTEDKASEARKLLEERGYDCIILERTAKGINLDMMLISEEVLRVS